MLRLIVLLLLLANAGFFAWAHGVLLPLGFGPVQQAEPQRLSQQLRPEALRLLDAPELQQVELAAAAPSTPPQCLASPVLDDATVTALRPLLAAWPATAWTLEPAVEPARWIVYMGRFDEALLGRKRSELRQLGVSFEPVAAGELAPGLTLGSHATEEAAARQLESLAQRGVRTARVVRERAELQGRRLTLPAVTDALRPRLEDLRPVLNGRPLRPCR